MDPELVAAIAALADVARSVGQPPVLIGALASAAAAAVLGAEVSSLASPAAAQRIREFLEVAGVDDGPFLLATVGQTFDEDEESRKIQAIKALVRAFAWGFERPAARS